MPKKLTWTDAQDSQIRRLRAEGASWDAIAAALGFTRWAIIERGRRIGAQAPPREFVPPPEDPHRDPLPPGHPTQLGRDHRRHAAGRLTLPDARVHPLTPQKEATPCTRTRCRHAA